MQNQQVKPTLTTALQPCCGKHKEPLQYFCNDPSCSLLLCFKCLAIGNHSDHDWKELRQAFVSMETRLVQAGHATEAAASTAQRQKCALRTEEDRLQSKCDTAKAIIRTNIGDIRSQFDNRKAYFEHNLEHAAQRHSFLEHRKPRETLSIECEALQELQKHGGDILARLASEDAMSLGEVEKATDRLKKIQDTVTKIQTQCSSPTSQFDGNLSKVRDKLSNYGKIKVDTFEQEPLPQLCSNIEPYESVIRTQSAIDLCSLQASQAFSSSKRCSTMKRPQMRKNFVLPPLPPTSSPTHYGSLLPSQLRLRTDMGQNTAERRLLLASQIEPEDTYDDTLSPRMRIPPVPSFPPPLPPAQDRTTFQSQDEELYDVPRPVF